MLSYRHSFHAGNFADVLKHIVLVELLEYICRKESGFDYIDTHAGAGVFELDSGHALKLQEHLEGIGRLQVGEWPEIETYFRILGQCNQVSDDMSTGKANQIAARPTVAVYPGSPLIAKHLIRAQDRAWLFELHTTDFQLLAQNVRGKNIRAMQEDGFKGLMRLLPPKSHRALVLMDPSYELKSDFSQIVATLMAAKRKFSSGIFAVWYPVVVRNRIEDFIKQVQSSGIRHIQRFELGVTADTEGSGMTASGMLVVNPPWVLMDKMKALLPRLVAALGRDEGAHFKAEVLVPE